MLEIKSKLKVPRAAYKVEVKGQLRLPFESRRQSRLRTRLVSGEDVGLALPRGEILRGGDLVTASDGRVIEVVSEKEKVLHIEASSATALAKVAYHLGDRHVPVEVGASFLRIPVDHVLEEMVKKLGATVKHLEAPFEPEAGVAVGAAQDEPGGAHDHAHGHDHGAHDHRHGGHDHVHDEHCGHDHHHPQRHK